MQRQVTEKSIHFMPETDFKKWLNADYEDFNIFEVGNNYFIYSGDYIVCQYPVDNRVLFKLLYCDPEKYFLKTKKEVLIEVDREETLEIKNVFELIESRVKKQSKNDSKTNKKYLTDSDKTNIRNAILKYHHNETNRFQQLTRYIIEVTISLLQKYRLIDDTNKDNYRILITQFYTQCLRDADCDKQFFIDGVAISAMVYLKRLLEKNAVAPPKKYISNILRTVISICMLALKYHVDNIEDNIVSVLYYSERNFSIYDVALFDIERRILNMIGHDLSVTDKEMKSIVDDYPIEATASSSCTSSDRQDKSVVGDCQVKASASSSSTSSDRQNKSNVDDCQVKASVSATSTDQDREDNCRPENRSTSVSSELKDLLASIISIINHYCYWWEKVNLTTKQAPEGILLMRKFLGDYGFTKPNVEKIKSKLDGKIKHINTNDETSIDQIISKLAEVSKNRMQTKKIFSFLFFEYNSRSSETTLLYFLCNQINKARTTQSHDIQQTIINQCKAYISELNLKQHQYYQDNVHLLPAPSRSRND